MPRLNANQWAEIRLRREATGESFQSLADDFGATKAAIHKRATKEGWGDGTDTNALANKLAWEKVNAKVDAVNPAAKLTAILDSSSSKAEIIERQQADWSVHREAYAVTDNPESLKAAKLSAEMLKLRHDGERRAHGIDETGGGEIVIDRSYGAK